MEKLLDGKFFTAIQAIHKAQREPFQQEGKYASSWNCEDWRGNHSTVIGLGTAWSYDAIFKLESKHLPKDAVEAKSRKRALEKNMYNDLAHASGGEYKNSLQVPVSEHWLTGSARFPVAV